MGSPGEEDAETAEIDYTNPPFPLTAIDRELLSMHDADFEPITWRSLHKIIVENKLEELKRRPAHLRRYLVWSAAVKQQYGGITEFVIQERLRWKPLPSSSSSSGPPLFEHRSETPFADARDYAILVNDWPYGFSAGITHLLVWTKTRIAVDEATGDVTEGSRRGIEEFVGRVFARELGEGEAGRERVLWFKNWVSLQSVRGVDHVHVLVRDVSAEVLGRWTERRDL